MKFSGNLRLASVGELRRTTVKSTPVVECRFAENSSRLVGDQKVEKHEFFTVQVYGKRAESLVAKGQKGAMYAIEGYVHPESWVEKGTDKKRSTVKLVAQSVQFLAPSKKSLTEAKA
jgi:single-stranded DNA-binding protein